MRLETTIAADPHTTHSMRITVDDTMPISSATPVTLCVYMGGASALTFATRDECRQIAEMMLKIASGSEALAQALSS